MVEKLPYVIGDFTWTAWDYLGEAGLGKAAYVDPDDPEAPRFPWDLMPDRTSPYPWRLANDADFDITGFRCPQGDYRSVVWGSEETFLYSMYPDTFGKKEVVSMWGFPYVLRNWNYEGFEGRPIELVVYSKADEAEVFVNGQSIGKKPVSKDGYYPNTVRFETTYQPGEVIAVSYKNGQEVSRAGLVTTGSAQKIRVTPEKSVMAADGHDLIYVNIEITDRDGRVVPDAAVALSADVSGAGRLAGFGSANPITEEDYTDSKAISYRGRALLIVRAGYESGTCSVEICAEGLEPVKAEFCVR